MMNKKNNSYYFWLLSANCITLIRLILSILFSMSLIGEDKSVIKYITLFLFIALSDFSDGKLSRYKGVSTKFGECFDVGTDLFFILSADIILLIQGKLPLYILLVTIFKFTEFLITSTYSKRENVYFTYDTIGRIASGGFFLVPILATTMSILYPDKLYLLHVFYIATSILSLMSSYMRIKGTFYR